MATYIVKPNQNLFDIALHLYGSIEGLFDLLISNPELNMNSELHYGQKLEYHDRFIINSTVVDEFEAQKITPSSGTRKVYFKRPEQDLLIVVGVNADMTYTCFTASGEGVMYIDWGDNSAIEEISLSVKIQNIEHYFDNTVESRRIKIYGDNSLLKFLTLDTTKLGGALLLCKPVIIDEYTCKNSVYSLVGLNLFQDTYKVDLQYSTVSNLLPIGDMSLQELNLVGVAYTNDSALDDYLEYIVKHYNDRRPCTVKLTTEPSERGYTAINTILNEPEWNISGIWKFYINNILYQANGTNS